MQLPTGAVDPLSGGAGYVGAGLLGCILIWLLAKHIPDLNRSQKDMVAKFQDMAKEHQTTMAQALAAQRIDFLASLSEERAEFRQALERILRQHEQQGAHLVAAIDKDAQLTREVIKELQRRFDEDERGRSRRDRSA